MNDFEERLEQVIQRIEKLMAMAVTKVPKEIEEYIVICRDDRYSETSPPGDYILATRQVFRDAQSALDYAATVSPSREAIVVEGRWRQLRFKE